MSKVPKRIIDYFYMETKDFGIDSISLVEKKDSYFDNVSCYHIKTKQKVEFYIFEGKTTLTNIYPIKKHETLDEVYYKHVGFIAEYTSKAVAQNFILDFIKGFSVFPILDRRLQEIVKEITLNKNSSQLSGIANQIRDCYLQLTDYLNNKNMTKNPNFKNDNFTDNLCEFLQWVLPGSKSESRRNTINAIAKKGWSFNAELIHKDSITVFDVMISFNILNLLVSSISDIITGNNMPFNKIKCPNCKNEKFTMLQNSDNTSYECVCANCNTHFEVSMKSITKDI